MKKEVKNEKKDMLFDTNEIPNPSKWFILALQHVFAMFGATILVPILVNSIAGKEVLTVPVALISSGIGTLIYILCTKGKSPVYLGSSFAYITPMAVAFVNNGISGVLTGLMIVGLIYVTFAIIVNYIGKAWLSKLLPPIIIGPMIIIIGLSLAPVAVNQIGLYGDTINWNNVLVAFIAFITTVVVATKAKGFLKVIPFLMGIIAGYISAIILGIVDFTVFKEAAILSIPNFILPFIDYIPSLAAVLTIAPIALVTIAEHIGDHTVLGTIINKDLLKDPGLDRTLLGDGIATFVGGIIGGPANTTYGENTAVVGMTKVASVWVIGLAAIISIVLGFFSKFTQLIATIPAPVFGGISLLLYGFIASNGLRILVNNKIDFGKMKNVIIASTMLVLGLGGAKISFISGGANIAISGMSLAAIIGITLNLLLPEENK